MFFGINRADEAAIGDLQQWSQEVAELVNQAQTMPIDLPLRIRIQSNAALISMISDEVLFEPDSFRGVQDRDGNLRFWRNCYRSARPFIFGLYSYSTLEYSKEYSSLSQKCCYSFDS